MDRTEWRKSSYSGPHDNCVEVMYLTSGVAVRDSKTPDGPAVSFASSEWRSFLNGLKRARRGGPGAATSADHV